jgi:hypothetical protein
MYDDNLTHTDIQYSTPVDLEALDAKPDTSWGVIMQSWQANQ